MKKKCGNRIRRKWLLMILVQLVILIQWIQVLLIVINIDDYGTNHTGIKHKNTLASPVGRAAKAPTAFPAPLKDCAEYDTSSNLMVRLHFLRSREGRVTFIAIDPWSFLTWSGSTCKNPFMWGKFKNNSYSIGPRAKKPLLLQLHKKWKYECTMNGIPLPQDIK